MAPLVAQQSSAGMTNTSEKLSSRVHKAPESAGGKILTGTTRSPRKQQFPAAGDRTLTGVQSRVGDNISLDRPMDDSNALRLPAKKGAAS
jgi:hypothetical protein